MNGWKCPECGRVFAPHVDECKYCGKYTTPQPVPEVPSPTVPYPSIPYPYPYTQPHVWPYREDDNWWRKPLVTWETKTISTDGTIPPLTVLY